MDLWQGSNIRWYLSLQAFTESESEYLIIITSLQSLFESANLFFSPPHPNPERLVFYSNFLCKKKSWFAILTLL